MALPDRQCLLLVVAVMAFCAAAASKDITGGYFEYDCPVNTGPSTTRGTAFDDNLRSLMAALPSAAAPTGFASLRSGRGQAFATARGLCFGESPPPESCRDCLSQSAGIVLDACDGNRSAAVWTDGCFLAYTDGNARAAEANDVFYGASPSSNDVSCDAEEVVPLARSLVPRAANDSSGRMLATAYTTCQANGGGDTVHALAQCPRDVAPADCALCLDKSARTLPDSLQWSRGIPVGASSLHRYNCTMRFERSPPAPPMGRGARIRKKVKDNIVVVIVGAVAIVAMISVAAFALVKRKVNKAQAARQLNSEVGHI
ncbi:putative cysteine-rich receptor-like protein kinase 9 [Triticum dicoccoides]|uniref:putative cysteine-rich receptor-like protein kinase 9 n=1 Tax=Triticum dicoccoides TaxID=85692 RepID=UPI00188F88DC|nr:putative cysteine-rich receptor-like protein kinase 9 [Triticum dicoccoides]